MTRDERLTELHGAGHPYREIAQSLGIALATVKAECKRLGLRRGSGNQVKPPHEITGGFTCEKNPNPKYLDPSRLSNLYREGKTDREIAELTGFTRNTVTRARMRHHLTVRHFSPVAVPAIGPRVPIVEVEVVETALTLEEVLARNEMQDGAINYARIHPLIVRIVEDESLLTLLLEHTCKVRPGLVRSTLRRVDERLTAILTGGYVERFGTIPLSPPKVK